MKCSDPNEGEAFMGGGASSQIKTKRGAEDTDAGRRGRQLFRKSRFTPPRARFQPAALIQVLDPNLLTYQARIQDFLKGGGVKTFTSTQRRRNRGALGARAPPPPHFSPQSMKCPTSTGVHARPTMYQEGVPRGAIQNRKTWGIAPRAINPGGTIKLLHYRKECPEGQ